MANISRNVPALPSLARTASNNSGDLKNNDFKSAHIIIDVTAVTATGSLVFTVEGKDALSGKYYTILQSAAITSVSTVVLGITPGGQTGANSRVNDTLPLDYRISVTHANAVSMTYSVGVNLLR